MLLLPVMIVAFMLTNTVNSRITRSTPDFHNDCWNKFDNEIDKLTGPLHYLLGMDMIENNEAGKQYAEILSNYLEAQPEFQEEALEFYKHNPPTSLEEARKVKNKLRKKAKHKDATLEEKQNFNKALKYYNFLLNQRKRANQRNSARKQEKEYRKNFYKFAKAATNGTLDEEKVVPTFEKEEADVYYKNKYSKPVEIDPTKLNWFPSVPDPTVPYNSITILPKEIKNILKNKSPSTCPGNDGLLYGILARLPTTHHFLATLYNKTEKSGVAMDISSNCYLVLAHKAGSSK